MSVKLQTTTARETELLQMIVERNQALEQLVAENERLRAEVDKLRCAESVDD
jgi:cell division protein FtsB